MSEDNENWITAQEPGDVVAEEVAEAAPDKPKPKKKKAAEDLAMYPTWMEENARTVAGKMWVRGTGPVPAKYLFVGERPGDKEARMQAVFSGAAAVLLRKVLEEHGFDYSRSYFTNAIKYSLPKNKNVQVRDIRVCRPMLQEEIARTNPEVIVCLGSTALKAVSGSELGISSVRGEFIPHPTRPNCLIYAMHGPSYVMRSPDAMPAFAKDIANLAAFQRGEFKAPPKPEYGVLTTAAEVRLFREWLFKTYEHPLLVLDMEWHGRTWMDPTRYIRTAQLGYAKGKVVIIEFHAEGGVPVMDDHAAAWSELKLMLEDPRMGIVGHNVIADGEWLRSYGVDIRKTVIFDTMLAEHLLHESGPFDLGEVAVKYSDYGRYSIPVELWVKAHPQLCEAGYGHVPRELLLPYGAIDVDAPRLAMMRQGPKLMAEGFFERRGANKEYPSLWAIALRTQELMYEIQGTGMLVDRARLDQLITAYQEVRMQLLGLVTTQAAMLGMPVFNPGAPVQVSTLLFETLQLPPVKTTAGRAWGDLVGNTGMDSDADYKASTDKTTLEILEDYHPIIHNLLQFRRIDQACKTWLRWPAPEDNEASAGGGLIPKIWPDGRLHSRFSPLTETGRFRTSKPNAQNWPKKAEGYMEEIFGGKDKVPPGIRTIIIPPEDHVLMEADFCQAELFVLAALSGDPNMWAALSTPGRDLHDLTAINAFKLKVLGPNNEEIPEQVLIDLAAANKEEGGAESKAFKSFIKQLTYLDLKGNRMSRDEFKNTIRVSAKNLQIRIDTDYSDIESAAVPA